jgi:DNA-binding beta-propeller fold protein YncE
MTRNLIARVGLALLSPAILLSAQQPSTDSPYKVVKSAKVGGEGGTDYIFADVVGRRLYIPRGAVRADTVNNRPAVAARVTVFDLETLNPVGEMLTAPNSQGNGAVVDPKTGHGFLSSRPGVVMFDAKTLQIIKTIPLDSGFVPDGIFFDEFTNRVYIGSHPTKDAIVIDPKDGTVTGKIDLGGTPEETASDGKGTIYFILQEQPGAVAVVDGKTLKVTARYAVGDHGRCNGLAMDAKNKILFAACALGGTPAVQGQPPAPATPTMIIMSATDGKIITELPLAGANDGAAFNPATLEVFTSHGIGTMTVIKEKSPTSFEVIENLNTMNGARTLTLDTKTGRLFVMSAEREPAPPVAPGGRPQQGRLIPGSFTIVVIGK